MPMPLRKRQGYSRVSLGEGGGGGGGGGGEEHASLPPTESRVIAHAHTF